MSALTASWTKSKTTQRRLRDLLAYILLAFGFVWFIFPLFWVLMSSLKTYADFNQIPMRVFPSELLSGQLSQRLEKRPLWPLLYQHRHHRLALRRSAS